MTADPFLSQSCKQRIQINWPECQNRFSLIILVSHKKVDTPLSKYSLPGFGTFFWKYLKGWKVETAKLVIFFVVCLVGKAYLMTALCVSCYLKIPINIHQWVINTQFGSICAPTVYCARDSPPEMGRRDITITDGKTCCRCCHVVRLKDSLWLLSATTDPKKYFGPLEMLKFD